MPHLHEDEGLQAEAPEKARSQPPEPTVVGELEDGLLGSPALEQTLAVLNEQQRQLLHIWLQEWECTAKLRIEQDTQLIAQLLLGLRVGVKQDTLPVGARISSTTTGLLPVTSQTSSSMTMAVGHTRTANTTSSSKTIDLLQPRLSTVVTSDESNNFTLLPIWSGDPDQEIQERFGRIAIQHQGRDPRVVSTINKNELLESMPIAGDSSSWLSPFMLFPGSPKKLTWDVLGAVLILFDLFSISLDVYSPPQNDVIDALNWVSLVFWTLNMGMSVTVGYTHDGVLVMSPKRILRRYLTTWFLVDLPVVGLDWIFTIYALLRGDGKAGSSVRLLRVLRLFRMVRLARLFKLRSILQSFYDLIDSAYLGIFADIGMMLVLLFLICHSIACLWFWVGTTQDGPTWINEHHFATAEWRYQYATSFHWAITQFTPASMSVQPQNIAERVFAIVVVFFALVCFSYVVGSITGSLTQLRMMRENESTQFWELRRYLRKHHVTHILASRIQKYLEHVLESERKNMPSKNVKILGLLSEQLKSELDFEICNSQLSVHPFFEHMTLISKLSMHRLANAAVEHRLLARDDEAFVYNEVATHTYFVVHGHMYYDRKDSRGVGHPEEVTVKQDWIAEPILWMKRWVHLGVLSAVIECDLLLLSPQKFQDVVRLNPDSFTLACTYARNFSEWINAEERDNLSDISQGEHIGGRVREHMEVGTSCGGLQNLKHVMSPGSRMSGLMQKL